MTASLGNVAAYAANIPRFFVYKALRGLQFGLITATWVIFLQEQHGLTLTQVTLIDVAFWIAATLGEVPTGILADTVGRKISLAVGTSVMGASMLVWSFAPAIWLITAAYAALAVGATFLSGAEDAFFYESLQAAGRTGDYVRLTGRVNAIALGLIALGNLASGLLATLDLRLPFVLAGLVLLAMFALTLSFKEPQLHDQAAPQPRQSYAAILRQAFTVLRAHPALRYAIYYLALAPMTAVILETVFLQPQALALGLPLAAVGAVVMAVQFAKMAGSSWAYRIQAQLGDALILYTAPALIIAALILLAAFQTLPALLFVGLIGFVTSVLRPLLLNRIQSQVSRDIRATILSLQALLFTMLIAVCEPLLGLLVDQYGFPTAYLALAGTLLILFLLLFAGSRRRFPSP